jgi:hypothetical protein
MTDLDAYIDRNAILKVRKLVRFQDGRPYDARCSTVAAALEAQFGWKRRWGRLRLLDSRVCWQHCWNQLADGRILDATADQFEARWLGDLVVLDASDPHATAYQSALPGWTFTLREKEQGIELDAAQDGAEVYDVVISCARWMDAARSALTMMTGWSMPLDLIDYAARVLRVRALLNSGDLDGLLAAYEWAHATAERGSLWMSSEYAAVLEEHECRAATTEAEEYTGAAGKSPSRIPRVDASAEQGE